MPLTLIQQFFYFLMVAALYASPLILLVLFLSWRKKAMTKGLVLVAAGLLLGAGLLQSSFQFSMLGESSRYEEEQRSLADYRGDISAPVASSGAYVGTERMGDLDYRLYQFPALDGSRRTLEVAVPPPGINAVAFLRHSIALLPELAAARLVVWSDNISMNPAQAPARFFSEYLSGADPYEFDEHTVLVSFRARNSTVVYPGAVGDEEWIWRDAVNEL